MVALIATLRDRNEEEWIRAHAAEALGTLGEARAINSLSDSLNNGLNGQELRAAAAKALKKFQGIALKGKTDPLKFEIEQLKAQGNVSELIHILEGKDLDHEMVVLVREALMDLGTNAMVGLLLALGDNQRTHAFNQLKLEGRLSDGLLRTGIGPAATDYRRKFEKRS